MYIYIYNIKYRLIQKGKQNISVTNKSLMENS